MPYSIGESVTGDVELDEDQAFGRQAHVHGLESLQALAQQARGSNHGDGQRDLCRDQQTPAACAPGTSCSAESPT